MDNIEIQEENQQMVSLIMGLFPGHKNVLGYFFSYFY